MRAMPPLPLAMALALASGLVPPVTARADSHQLLGAEVWRNACAGCHGAEARGDGPLAGLLLTPVPDLTGLAARAGGAFPRWEVIQTVDGRTAPRAHGGPMPIFGELLRGDRALTQAPDGSPLTVSARLLAVVDWLESVQAP